MNLNKIEPMIKVNHYISTVGTEKYKNLINKPFTLDLLYPIYKESSVETLFHGWRGKDMRGWFRFTHDNDDVLEFYPDYYVIKKNGDNVGTRLSVPETINEFIDDILRYGFDLYWTDWIDLHLEPKDYLHRGQIKSYYQDLLNKIDKGFELI